MGSQDLIDAHGVSLQGVSGLAMEPSELEDVVTSALVRRGGVQICMEPSWSRAEDTLSRGVVTMALLHPSAGKVIAARHEQVVHRLELEILAFYRRMLKVLVLQRELRRRDVAVSCIVAAPAAVLSDPRQLEKLVDWAISYSVAPESIDLKFENRVPLGGSMAPKKIVAQLVDAGFGVAFDVTDLSRGCAAALDVGRPRILIAGDMLDTVSIGDDRGSELRRQLEIAMQRGAIPLAWGITNRRSLQLAARLGLVSGGQFSQPDAVVSSLQIANAYSSGSVTRSGVYPMHVSARHQSPPS